MEDATTPPAEQSPYQWTPLITRQELPHTDSACVHIILNRKQPSLAEVELTIHSDEDVPLAQIFLHSIGAPVQTTYVRYHDKDGRDAGAEDFPCESVWEPADIASFWFCVTRDPVTSDVTSLLVGKYLDELFRITHPSLARATGCSMRALDAVTEIDNVYVGARRRPETTDAYGEILKRGSAKESQAKSSLSTKWIVGLGVAVVLAVAMWIFNSRRVRRALVSPSQLVGLQAPQVASVGGGLSSASASPGVAASAAAKSPLVFSKSA